MKQEYTLVENENVPDKTGIKLIGGDYDGIIYIYGEVKLPDISTESTEDLPTTKFEYQVLNNPNNVEYKESPEFINVIGDILLELIGDNVRENDRRNDNQKPDNE
jgi:hypothetical protein